jgi:hypothetical protein
MAGNLTPAEIQQQVRLLQEQDKILQRIEERNKRIAIAGQDELKRLEKRNKKDEDHLDNLKETLNKLSAVEAEAKDYEDTWDTLLNKQDDFNDYLKESQIEISKMSPEMKKMLGINQQNTKVTSGYLAISTLLAQSKKKQINASEEERKILINQDSILSKIAKDQEEAAEEVVTSRQELFGISEETKRRLEFEKSIVGLSKQQAEAARDAFKQTENLKKQAERYEKIQENITELGEDLPESITESYKGLGKVLSALKAASPLLLSFAVIGLAAEAFYDLDKEAENFRKNTGLTVKQTVELSHQVHEIEVSMRKFGVEAKTVYDVMEGLTKSFSAAARFSEETLKSLSVISARTGVTGETAAKVQAIFQQIGGYSEETAANLQMQVSSLAQQAGASPQKVLEDIADNAEATSKFFKGDINLLKNQAIEANRLGTSLKEVTKVAENLLDFEQSIGDELTAATFVGGQFNLSRARGLAADNKIVEANQEIVDQIQRSGDFRKQDYYTQQALAKAAGMSIEQINKQLGIREQLSNLTTEEKEEAMKAMEAGLDVTKINKDQLNDKVKEFAQQQKINGQVTDLANQFKGITTSIGGVFVPILQKVADALTFITGNAAGIGALFGTIAGIALLIWYRNREAALAKAEEVAQQQQLLALQLQYFEAQTASLGATSEKLAVNTADTIVETTKSKEVLFQSIAQGGLNQKKKTGLMTSIGTAIADTFSGFTKWLGPIGTVLALAAVGGLIGIVGKYMVGDLNSPADGKTTVSTKEGGLFELSPNDDLIAAPGASEAMKGGGASGALNLGILSAPLNTMVSELRMLRDDLRGGKIAVYMDGAKVTSGLAKNVEKSTRNNYNLA